MRIVLAACTALSVVAALPAVAASSGVGSGNTVVVEPPIRHPATTPCVVPLYRGATFGANNVNFTYTPPAACAGPWGAVVLSVDVSLDAGIQYDRTGTIWIGGVPFWFGTTAEPTPSLAPSWHFERNVTDLSATLKTAQSGFVLIANYTNSQDTSIITTSARLLFYPPSAQFPAPPVPDVVIPLAAPGGGTVALGNSTSTVAITQTLPTNIAAAALDVYTQSQSGDEFWYTCVPNSLSSELQSCGGGAVREGEVTVDNTPAGVAPVYPWIYTGGIDPYLWAPITGVQTLSFRPFRVELSPFAGLLSNGASHTIALSVYGANNYFSAAGALLLWLDPDSTQVTGGVTQNTLEAPNPVINNTIQDNGGVVSGAVNSTLTHDFQITGTVVTSQGTLTKSVEQLGHFANLQNFDITGSTYRQDISQDTLTYVRTAISGGGTDSATMATYDYPLGIKLFEVFTQNGGRQKTTIQQGLHVNVEQTVNSANVGSSGTQYQVNTTDLLKFNSSFNITGHKNQASSANYIDASSQYPCFGEHLQAANNILTARTYGCKAVK